MDSDALRDAIGAGGLSHLADRLERVMAPAIGVRGRRCDSQEIGTSRFGGAPDLPAPVQWPCVDGIALMFVGQVRLEDITGFPAAKGLPRGGLLSFFFDGMLTGYDGGQAADRCRVVLTTEPVSSLRRCEPPGELPSTFRVFDSSAVSWAETWTIPSIEEINSDEFPTIPAVDPIVATPEDRRRYIALRKPLITRQTRLMGHPDEVQGGELRFDMVCRRDHEDRFRYEDYAWTNEAALVSQMRDLCLLMQSATDPDLGVDWGGGMVYFWIDREDLAQARFDRAFACFQST